MTSIKLSGKEAKPVSHLEIIRKIKKLVKAADKDLAPYPFSTLNDRKMKRKDLCTFLNEHFAQAGSCVRFEPMSGATNAIQAYVADPYLNPYASRVFNSAFPKEVKATIAAEKIKATVEFNNTGSIFSMWVGKKPYFED